MKLIIGMHLKLDCVFCLLLETVVFFHVFIERLFDRNLLLIFEGKVAASYRQMQKFGLVMRHLFIYYTILDELLKFLEKINCPELVKEYIPLYLPFTL